MLRHLLTAGILLAAVVCYSLGRDTLGTAGFILGIGFECWFWFRLVDNLDTTDDKDKS
jgi:hypothetical protein